MNCISRHDALSDNVTDEYPYLLNLPSYSPSKLGNLKKDHIMMMDDYFEDRDYVSAKKHAMIILKYFNGNDIQTLSTLGNIMRDEDRQNLENIQCAVNIHSTPFIGNTSWGTISLAEDNHVLGNFERTSELVSPIINRYESYDESEVNPIEKVTYKNALIINANALFRTAMAQQADNVEDVRIHYTMAHDIEKSYDTWFGLGNLDRYQGNFEDALEKYEHARELARDTTEIDYEINVMKSYL
jgi:tetratricopeptide (TPR) repeat protein